MKTFKEYLREVREQDLDEETITEGSVHDVIKKAIEKHKSDEKKVQLHSPAYYYAKTMQARGKAALKIKDPNEAWKHYTGNNLSESEDLVSESTFVSNSPSTGASVGVKFDVKKNAEKSNGELTTGHPKEHFDVFHNGEHVGSVHSYSGYKDKKTPGLRYVNSRKDVRQWVVMINGGQHNRHGSHWDSTPEHSVYSSAGFGSKKDALQHLADSHKSNKNR